MRDGNPTERIKQLEIIENIGLKGEKINSSLSIHFK